MTLERNYRSTEPILAAANAVISLASERFTKNLRSGRLSSDLPELVLAFELRSTKAWGWLAVSALASIVLSLAILSGWPGTSLVTLGVLIGVNFVSSGLAFLLLGIGAKRETQA